MVLWAMAKVERSGDIFICPPENWVLGAKAKLNVETKLKGDAQAQPQELVEEAAPQETKNSKKKIATLFDKLGEFFEVDDEQM